MLQDTFPINSGRWVTGGRGRQRACDFPKPVRAHEVFLKSDGEAARQYYSRLNAIGPQGELATALMRVLKRSKNREGFGYRSVSSRISGSPINRRRRAEQYDRADAYEWAIKELQRILLSHFQTFAGHSWGFRDGFLYLFLLEHGPVRFSVQERGILPDYRGGWDEAMDADAGDLRVVQFCDSVDVEKPAEPIVTAAGSSRRVKPQPKL